MSYDYRVQKAKLFTEDGASIMLRVRDNVFKMLAESGAVMMDNAFKGCSGYSWTMMAAVDYLVERGEVREITGPDVCGQHRVFVKGR